MTYHGVYGGEETGVLVRLFIRGALWECGGGGDGGGGGGSGLAGQHNQ